VHQDHRQERIDSIQKKDDFLYPWDVRSEELRAEESKQVKIEEKRALRYQVLDMMGSLLRQIRYGSLSAEGAAFKILRMVELIYYFDLADDEEVLEMYDRTVAAYRSKFERKMPSLMDIIRKQSSRKAKMSAQRLSMMKDLISDSNLDPKYTDQVGAKKASHFLNEFEKELSNPKNMNSEHAQNTEYLYAIAVRKALKENDPERIQKGAARYGLNGKLLKPTAAGSNDPNLDLIL
jgi:hypothetical protein